MVSSRAFNQDLCPVCCQFHAQPGHTYCSNECRKVANRFRRRFDRTLKQLEFLGFRYFWQNGVALCLELPEPIKQFYPHHSHRIIWPEPGWNVDGIAVAAIWELFDEWLHPDVCRFVKHMVQNPHAEIEFSREAILDWAAFVHLHPTKTFFCEICNRTFIASFHSRYKEGPLCYDCEIEDIPF